MEEAMFIAVCSPATTKRAHDAVVAPHLVFLGWQDDEAAHEEKTAALIRKAEEKLAQCMEKQEKELGFHQLTKDEFQEWTPAAASMSAVAPAAETDSTTGLGIGRKLRLSTFFVNYGRSLEQNFERRGFEGYGLSNGEEWRERVEKATCGAFVRVPTQDGREIDGIFIEAWPDRRLQEVNAVAVVFHANAMLNLDMASWGKWYAQRGIHALCVTMGGYAGSELDPERSMTEMTTYFDAQAAIDFAKHTTGCPNHKILVHGLSIGGGLAAAAAKANPGVHCTVDQTFVNSEEVALICAKEVSQSLPSWIVKSAVKSMFHVGVADPRLPGYVSDGFNTEAKLGQVLGQVFVLSASQDDMMPPEFAVRLFNARYEKGEQAAGAPPEAIAGRHTAMEPLYSRLKESRMVEVDGWHCTFFGYDATAVKIYEHYMTEVFKVKAVDIAVRGRGMGKPRNLIQMSPRSRLKQNSARPL